MRWPSRSSGEIRQRTYSSCLSGYGGSRGTTRRACPYLFHNRITFGQSQGIAPTLALSDVIKRFKSLTTKQYIVGVRKIDWQPINGKLWQRNYYEHIIRNDNELEKIREQLQNVE